MSFVADLVEEPWRFDFYGVMRHLERTRDAHPRIGDSRVRAEDIVSLSQDPFLEFPASTLSAAFLEPTGRMRITVRFLGFFGPQGALPIATTEEAYGWLLADDDAFPRFVDIFQNRFLQLFFRAWADANPLAQHDRPGDDRFADYVGSIAGIGTPATHGVDTLPADARIAYAGLIAPEAKSASRLADLLVGLFGLKVEIDEFQGSWLVLEPEDRTRIGGAQSRLGIDTLVGGAVFSVSDKIRIRLFARTLADYLAFLPSGSKAELLFDAVFLHIGDRFDWDVELALPIGEVVPTRLGGGGRLGWTTWMAPNWTEEKGSVRTDARFHLRERIELKRHSAA